MLRPNQIHVGATPLQRSRVGRDTRTVLTSLRRTGLLSCLTATPVAILYLDIQWLGNGVGERSLVEVAQLLALSCALLSFCTLAISRNDRRFAVLASAFFTCMMIRELDAAWDLVADGLWQCLVILVASSGAIYSLLDCREMLRGMARLLASRDGLLLTLGLVLLLVYSRLLGMGSLWHGLLGEQYIRPLKNAIEEGSELLGYVFIAAAGLSYAIRRTRTVNTMITPSSVHHRLLAKDDPTCQTRHGTDAAPIKAELLPPSRWKSPC